MVLVSVSYNPVVTKHFTTPVRHMNVVLLLAVSVVGCNFLLCLFKNAECVDMWEERSGLRFHLAHLVTWRCYTSRISDKKSVCVRSSLSVLDDITWQKQPSYYMHDGVLSGLKVLVNYTLLINISSHLQDSYADLQLCWRLEATPQTFHLSSPRFAGWRAEKEEERETEIKRRF